MKIYKIITSILLAMTLNNLVNISSNLSLGIRHPEIYFPLVISGIILNFFVLCYGSYKVLEAIVEHES